MATIKRRGKSYLIRIYAGYNADGRQVERTMTWTPPDDWTEKRADREAQHQAALFEEQIRNGLEADKKIKFSEFGERWFRDYAEKQLRPRTIARYRDLWVRINAGLGHITLDKLRPVQILDFYETINSISQHGPCRPLRDIKYSIRSIDLSKEEFSRKAGVSLSTLSTVFQRKAVSRQSAEKIASALDLPFSSCFVPIAEDRPLSPTTVKKYHQLVNKMLQDAMNWQYIPYNPCSRISSPRAADTAISYLDDKQARHLMDLLKAEPGLFSRPVSLLLLTGMRRGELLGLEWQDIDFHNKTLFIQRSSQYLAGRGVYTDEPKNPTSKRVIAVPDAVLSILEEQRQWQMKHKATLKDGWTQSGRVITVENGRPMRPDCLTHWFSRFIAGTDLPQIHLHSLRHTYATLCISKGIPLTAVAAQMGHANIATTAKIYAHAIQSAQIAAANKIGSMFECIF